VARDVDDAMAADRPEKQTVRRLWVHEARLADCSEPPEPVPLYLTLPGAAGRDIQALVDAGLINLTETGAIADAESMRLVAVEHSPMAVVALLRRFPGLKILEQPLHSLLHSTSPVAWPVGEHKTLFRAQVVNLDLDSPLKAEVKSGQLSFPILALVRKLATLHAVAPYVDWTLCLTLHGEITWGRDSHGLVCQFLASNFQNEALFSDAARAVLGDDLHRGICEDPSSVDVRDLLPATQQRLLMVLVPKRIAFDVHREGWCVDTIENLCYGGTRRRAPMVTWVLRFRWDVRASTQPEVLYRGALGRALERRGSIDADGTLSRAG
jgi:hypothetical protein